MFSHQPAIEMLQYLLCRIIVICRFKLYKQRLQDLDGQQYNIGYILGNIYVIFSRFSNKNELYTVWIIIVIWGSKCSQIKDPVCIESVPSQSNVYIGWNEEKKSKQHSQETITKMFSTTCAISAYHH
jgi:hypothetical protein